LDGNDELMLKPIIDFPVIGYTAENVSRKVTNFDAPDDVTYPTTQAVLDEITEELASEVPATRTISTTSPLSGGGDLSTNRTLSIANAAADGTTKGAASFAAADFNSSNGLISIDYTNGQAANGSTKGFLASADWSTFNGKENVLTFSAPLSRSTNIISLPVADATHNGYLTSADWSTFNGKSSFSGLYTGLDFTGGSLNNLLGTPTTRGIAAVVYIALRATDGVGTAEDPRGVFGANDAAKAVKFDSIMDGLSSNTLVVLMGGSGTVFPTNGQKWPDNSKGWTLKTGEYIQGNGATIRLISYPNAWDSGVAKQVVLGTRYYEGTVNGILIENLVVDANWQNLASPWTNKAVMPVFIYGASNCTLRNVEATNMYGDITSSQECFSLALAGYGTAVTGNRAINCKVTSPRGNYHCGVCFFGGDTTHLMSDSFGEGNQAFGKFETGLYNIANVDGLYVSGGFSQEGPYLYHDTGTAKNIVIKNPVCRKTWGGGVGTRTLTAVANSWTISNWTIRGGEINVINNTGGLNVGIGFYSDAAVSNVVVSDCTVTQDSTGSSGATQQYALQLYNVAGARISHLTTPLELYEATGSTGVSFNQVRTATGAVVSSMLDTPDSTLLHTTGNETKTGVLTTSDTTAGVHDTHIMEFGSAVNDAAGIGFRTLSTNVAAIRYKRASSGQYRLYFSTWDGSAILDRGYFDNTGLLNLTASLSVGANVTISGLTASSFLETDSAKQLVSKTAAQMRTDLSLVIGANVQAWDADLDALAALSGTNTIYYRSAANTWTAVIIGGNLSFSAGTLNGLAGTVTSFSAGDLSPLFTTSEATTTTTPALTFSLSNAAAHTFFGNETGSTATPHFVQPAFTDISGRTTSAQMPLGAQLNDNAGTPKLAADLNTRIGYSSDGTTGVFTWDGGFYIGSGAANFELDGTGSFNAGTIIWDGSGNFTASSFSVPNGAGGGYFELQNQSAAPSTPFTNSIRLYVDSTGQLSWKRSDGFVRKFASTLTADRIFTWPDASGTVAFREGVITVSDAAAGSLGEYIVASVVQGSATALTTATPKTVTSISLTAGDWDVTAIGCITGASTGTNFDVAIGATTNSFTGTVLGNTRCETPTVSLTGADATLMIPAVRVNVSSTTTYYLVVQETFTIGTPAAYGRISARRVR
jgi:hypothetical protein